MRSNRKILFFLLTILVGSTIFFSHFLHKNIAEPEPTAPNIVLKEGDSFPYEMEVITSEGKRISLSQWKGSVLLINYWASWCSPCIHEMPALYSLHSKMKNRGLVVLGVSMDENFTSGIEALKRVVGAPPFDLVEGQNKSISNIFPIEGLPYSVLVDREGKIRYAQPGEVEWDGPEALKLIEKAM